MNIEFQRINKDRWQVLLPSDQVTEKQMIEGIRRGVNPRFLGTVHKQEFVTYVDGHRVKRSFWLARSKGYMPVGKAHPSRKEAGEALYRPPKSPQAFVGPQQQAA